MIITDEIEATAQTQTSMVRLSRSYAIWAEGFPVDSVGNCLHKTAFERSRKKHQKGRGKTTKDTAEEIQE